jgi:L-fuconolactonase
MSPRSPLHSPSSPTDLASLAVVDTHSHVIAQDEQRYPRAPMGGKASDWSRERPADAPAMLAAMAAAGVAQSVLVQASTCYGHDSSYVAAAVQAHPAHFIGVYSVDPLAVDAVQQVQRWSSAGLAGLRIFIAGHTTANHDVRLDDPRGFPVWQYAADHHIPICVQIRADGLPQLALLLREFPKVNVLLDHFARPVLEDGPPYAQAQALFALAAHNNLHFKFTSHNVRESKVGLATQASFARTVVDVFGAQRIAWGSNFSASSGSLKEQLDEALSATAELSGEERRWIFSGTARALYPTLGKAGA